MSDDVDRLPDLLAHRRAAAVDLWLDPASPATALLMPYLDLDGHANGGRPWRFRGHDLVGLRLLPGPGDPVSTLVARCVLAVRAWAVGREGDDHLVPMDYDLPWSYLSAVQQDLAAVRAYGLPHLVALAGRHGDWLGDWVAEAHDHPAVHQAVADEVTAAAQAGVVEPPCVMVGTRQFAAAAMPDDVHEQVAALLGG